MKKGSTLFLRIVLCLIAIVTIAGMLWFPKNEGRAANLDIISIYTDPLIIYAFIASIPFFIGLYQAFKLLKLIEDNKAFTKSAIDKIKNIKYTSISLICFIVLGIIFIRFFAEGDDPAGPTALGFVTALAFGVIATAAAVLQKLFQNAVDLKSENDLTV